MLSNTLTAHAFFLVHFCFFSVAFLPAVETELSALRLLLVPCVSICLYAFRTVFRRFYISFLTSAVAFTAGSLFVVVHLGK